MSSFKFPSVVLAVAFLFGSHGLAAADAGTVVASNSDTYPVGTVLEDDVVVVLEDGATVSIMMISGRGIKLAGPFEGSIMSESPSSEDEQSVTDKLGQAVLESDGEEAVLGGIRGF